MLIKSVSYRKRATIHQTNSAFLIKLRLREHFLIKMHDFNAFNLGRARIEIN